MVGPRLPDTARVVARPRHAGARDHPLDRALSPSSSKRRSGNGYADQERARSQAWRALCGPIAVQRLAALNSSFSEVHCAAHALANCGAQVRLGSRRFEAQLAGALEMPLKRR